MPIDDQRNGPELPASLAMQLRMPFRVGSDFESRVMAAVRHDAAHGPSTEPRAAMGRDHGARVRRGSRWRVLGAWLAAAALLAVTAGVTHWWTIRTMATPAASPVARTRAADTVYVVRFVYATPPNGPRPQRVSLVGDFNGWEKGAIRLSADDPTGSWTATVTLPPGRHEYAFVVHATDGDHWSADPGAPMVLDEFGTETSTLVVGPTQNVAAPRHHL